MSAMAYFCRASPSLDEDIGPLNVVTCFVAKTSFTIFSTRALNSSDSAAMPSGPFMLSRTTSTFAGRMTTLRIMDCLELIFGCRTCARTTNGDTATTSATSPTRVAVRSLHALASIEVEVMSGFSLELQCVFEFFRDPRRRAQVPDISRTRGPLHLAGPAFRKACPARDGLPETDFPNSPRAGKALRLFADASSSFAGLLGSRASRALPLPVFVSLASSRHLSLRCWSAPFQSVAANEGRGCDKLQPAGTHSPRNSGEIRPGVAPGKPQSESARRLSLTECRGA